MMLRQVGFATLFRIFALTFACLAAGHVCAQTRPPRPSPGEIYIAPDSHAYEMKQDNRRRILCDARSEVYDRQQCDRTCTNECKSIGASLRECDPPKVMACTR